MVLLGLDDVTTKHLGVLYFDGGIIKDKIVIVDVLNNLNRLLLALLLWL